VTSPLKVLGCAVLVAISIFAGGAKPAAAATPCWKALLNDWYDGRIDKSYAIHCYREALRHLPTDVQTYSSAHDDILRALQNAQAKLKKGTKEIGPNTIIPGGPSPSNGTQVRSEHHGGTTTTPTPGRKTGDGLPGVAKQLNPSSPSSVPVPLLVLGGLAILLVAAGAAGLIAKRIQGRRPGP
jgi:hypothetical protein